MRKIHLTPVDQFYFRGHNDLTPGLNHAASTSFMPRPGTVYGALRAAYIHRFHSFTQFAKEESHPDVEHWMGSPNRIGSFKLKGLLLTYKENPIYPLPLDMQVVSEKKASEDEPIEMGYQLLLDKNIQRSSDKESCRFMAEIDGKSSSSEGKFIKEEMLKNIIFHKNEPIKLLKVSDILKSESKVGIALDYSKRRSQDSMLYSLNQYSFVNKDSSFLALANKEESPSFKSIPFARLGGGNNPFLVKEEEGFTILNKNELEELTRNIKDSGIAKIILLTPAIWEKGSRPKYYDNDTKILTLGNGIKVTLLAASIGRPTIVGGWDIQKGRPKKRMNAVPAGSVLYVKVEKEQVEDFVNHVYLGQLTDEYEYEGYGLTIPGVYKRKGN